MLQVAHLPSRPKVYVVGPALTGLRAGRSGRKNCARRVIGQMGLQGPAGPIANEAPQITDVDPHHLSRNLDLRADVRRSVGLKVERHRVKAR